MFIVAPISRVSEVKSVIDAGANEVYCGLLTSEQWDNYANISCLNRRAEISSNLSSYDELKRVVAIAHSSNVPVCLTLNEFYGQEQAVQALIQLDNAIECGIDKVIVSDIGLLEKIKERGYRRLQLHISSCASIFNSETVKFYKIFSPSRIILNRQLTLGEIEHIQKSFPEMETEVFILNEKCYNIDGLCTFIHGRLSPAYNIFTKLVLNIMQNRNIKYIPRFLLYALHCYVVKNSLSCCFSYSAQHGAALNGAEKEIFFNKANLFLQACGICALYDFFNMGIKFFKISGRSLLVDKTRDIRLLKEAIHIAKEEPIKINFYEKVRNLARGKYHRACSPEYCYYDEMSNNNLLEPYL